MKKYILPILAVAALTSCGGSNGSNAESQGIGEQVEEIQQRAKNAVEKIVEAKMSGDSASMQDAAIFTGIEQATIQDEEAAAQYDEIVRRAIREMEVDNNR